MRKTQIGRLALRHEGDNWNAYYASLDTMDGAIPLASIKMTIVTRHPDRKSAFLDLMRDAVADIIEDATGQRPTYPDGIRSAPEHERAGHS
jgi:hypothetical protein